MVPPSWQGTGIGKEQAPDIETMPHVHWHLLDGPDHPLLRSDASDQGDLIDFVCALAPDLTLCRSADVRTPALFPGEVRFIMEGGAPPFVLGGADFTLKHGVFDHGSLPPMDMRVANRLDEIAADMWPEMLARLHVPTRAEFMADARISPEPGQLFIALPLEYEHPENFFGSHHAFASNADMITAIAEEIDGAATLLVTHHPLTELHGDTSAANAAILRQGGRVKLLSRARAPGAFGGDASMAMIRHCDGAVFGNSKSWSIAAAFGTPMTRISSAPGADWMNAYSATGPLIEDIQNGCARGADPSLTRRWFAHHILNLVMDPDQADFYASDMTDRAFQPVDPARWDRALARYRSLPCPPTHAPFPTPQEKASA